MLKDILIGQKKELEKLLDKPFIERDATKNAKKFVANDLVKVVLGPRRAGKSIFSAHLFRGHNPAYVNFDDENLTKVKNYDEITRELHAIYGSGKYLLFDEIAHKADYLRFHDRRCLFFMLHKLFASCGIMAYNMKNRDGWNKNGCRNSRLL